MGINVVSLNVICCVIAVEITRNVPWRGNENPRLCVKHADLDTRFTTTSERWIDVCCVICVASHIKMIRVRFIIACLKCRSWPQMWLVREKTRTVFLRKRDLSGQGYHMTWWGVINDLSCLQVVSLCMNDESFWHDWCDLVKHKQFIISANMQIYSMIVNNN